MKRPRTRQTMLSVLLCRLHSPVPAFFLRRRQAGEPQLPDAPQVPLIALAQQNRNADAAGSEQIRQRKRIAPLQASTRA